MSLPWAVPRSRPAGEAVHAFVSGPEVDPDALRSWAAQRLEPAALPATITVLDRIPTTPLGKADRSALRALLAGEGGDPGRAGGR